MKLQQPGVTSAPDPVSPIRSMFLAGVQAMAEMKFDWPPNEYARFYLELGRAEGTAALIAKILAQRFGPLTDELQAQIAEARMWKLERIADRLLTSQTLDDALRM